MPGLLTLRPLASAGKAAKSTAAKNAVSVARAEKVRDDRSQGQQGKVSPPTFARARVLRAPALHRAAPPPPQAPAVLQPSRPKQVTDPLGEAVKEELRGSGLDIKCRMGFDYSSSGSEHEPNSVCLAEMVFDYIEEDLDVGKCGRARCNCNSSCAGELSLLADNEDTRSSLGGEMIDVLQALTPCNSLSERNIFAAVNSTLDALKEDAAGHFEASDESNRSSLTKRWVMTVLRSSGYNAAVCKSRWEHAGGFPGGDYEYLDVILEAVGGKSERILVDIDFKAQFEIARPTNQYSALLQSLPSVYVGKSDRLQQILNIMCDAAKRSLKKKGMHLPPWRKPDYIKAKWFSSYRRTTNGASLSTSKSCDGSDIARIALRGSGWDSKFTSEMENSYLKAADARKALRATNAEIDSRLSKPVVRQKIEDEPEGKVRGANRMGFLALNDVPAGGHELTGGETEWQPPVVIPRATQRTGKMAGLASILMEAGLTKEAREELREPYRQPGALSQQIAMAGC